MVIGVDPGPTPGVCRLIYRDGVLTEFRIFQTNHEGCFELVNWLMPYVVDFDPDPCARRVLAVERFVVGRASLVSSGGDAGQITRDMIGALSGLAARGVEVVTRSAAEVKPWAIDERLKKAGLLSRVLGMPHARDAVRHALYSAVADLGVRDPLSNKVVGVAK